MALTKEQVENIQIDYGIVVLDYDLPTERRLGPTRGGGTFNATATLRDIEFDGRKGKTKGMQSVDEINATLSVVNLSMSMEDLAVAMPWATYQGGKISGKTANIGILPNSAYLGNITMFCKVIDGGYKKITLYNPMNGSEFSIAAAPKAEGTVSLTLQANWDSTDDTKDLFEVEDVETLGTDTTKPTVVTVPIDGATSVVVSSNLTATFSEDIKQSDITTSNFMLVKVSDGTIVAGTLTYTLATKTAMFDPTASLAADSDYIWMITNVRDLAGNKMDSVAVNFKTA